VRRPGAGQFRPFCPENFTPAGGLSVTVGTWASDNGKTRKDRHPPSCAPISTAQARTAIGNSIGSPRLPDALSVYSLKVCQPCCDSDFAYVAPRFADLPFRLNPAMMNIEIGKNFPPTYA